MFYFKDFITEKIAVNGVEINFKYLPNNKKPLLLIHGYPQTHFMWHKIADELSKDYCVVCPDLRGYGDSSKPKGLKNHENYSKKNMAKDMILLMENLGYENFYLAGHDRGARVAHRLCLDYPKNITKACVMDICPTFHMFENTDQAFATGYYHWFFLIQNDGLPEKMIGEDPTYYLKEKLKRWSSKDINFEDKFDDYAVNEYIRCFDKESIHATCEDYRAAASIDMQDDKKDKTRKIDTPLLVLWGEKGFVNRTYDVINVWKEYATNIRGKALNCGHFLPEESPSEVIDELRNFFKE